jgi:hypothetical protein
MCFAEFYTNSKKVFENSFLYEVRTLSGVSLLARIACGCVLRRAF